MDIAYLTKFAGCDKEYIGTAFKMPFRFSNMGLLSVYYSLRV